MMTQKIIRTYSELIRLETFEERFEYLKIFGIVGEDTFGYDRYLNQLFYKSPEWQDIRDYVITRDGGCDLAIPDREIHGEPILIHHMNPITKEDILNKTDFLLNPNYLITTVDATHKALHYGNRMLDNNYNKPVQRYKNDTCPWRH